MTLGNRAGLGASEVENLRIAVTEIASNTVNHGGGGELLLRMLEQDGRTGVEALFVDSGQGMANVAECLRELLVHRQVEGVALGGAVEADEVHVPAHLHRDAVVAHHVYATTRSPPVRAAAATGR